MALDHLIEIARDHFGIKRAEDWQKVRPEWILQLHGCGESTLDHIRLYLAARGLTLQDDQTPNYWQTHLATAKIGGRIAATDIAKVEPFTIIVDSQEKHPFTFQGFTERDTPLIVPTQFRSLGPHHGDYSITGLERQIHIERKSLEDAHGTFLSHGDRRDRWEQTLAFLAEIPATAIVVECSLGILLSSIEPRGKRSKSTLQKTLHRQVLAWQHDLLIPFHFCDNRRLAEATTLAVLRRYWQHANGLKRSRQIQEDCEIIAGL